MYLVASIRLSVSPFGCLSVLLRLNRMTDDLAIWYVS